MAPDRRQERPQRLRPSLPDLAGEAGAEHVVVQVGAGDEEPDERALHREHPVEARRGRVERARRGSRSRRR